MIQRGLLDAHVIVQLAFQHNQSLATALRQHSLSSGSHFISAHLRAGKMESLCSCIICFDWILQLMWRGANVIPLPQHWCDHHQHSLINFSFVLLTTGLWNLLSWSLSISDVKPAVIKYNTKDGAQTGDAIKRSYSLPKNCDCWHWRFSCQQNGNLLFFSKT